MELYRWLRYQWDRTGAVLLVVLGLLALLLGWLGVSRNGLPAAQIPYLASGAVLGLFCLGAAATLWLSADLRDLWRKLDDMHHDLTADAEGRAESQAGVEVPGEANADTVGAIANGRRQDARVSRSSAPGR